MVFPAKELKGRQRLRRGRSCCGDLAINWGENMRKVVGLDFGTTNSAIAVATDHNETVLTTFWEEGQPTNTFRSILYFDPEHLEPTGKPRAVGGPEAIARYLQADPRGRLIQSMKSHLASSSFKHTVIFNHTYVLEELIALIVRQLKATAEVQF